MSYFLRLAICARTWASTLVGSWTASLPNTLIKLAIFTENEKKKNSSAKQNYQFHGTKITASVYYDMNTFWLWRCGETKSLFLLLLLQLFPATLTAQLFSLLLWQHHRQGDRLILVNCVTEKNKIPVSNKHYNLQFEISIPSDQSINQFNKPTSAETYLTERAEPDVPPSWWRISPCVHWNPRHPGLASLAFARKDSPTIPLRESYHYPQNRSSSVRFAPVPSLKWFQFSSRLAQFHPAVSPVVPAKSGRKTINNNSKYHHR